MYLAIYSHDNSIYYLDQNYKMQVNRCKIPTQQVYTMGGIPKYHPKVNISFWRAIISSQKQWLK